MSPGVVVRYVQNHVKAVPPVMDDIRRFDRARPQRLCEGFVLEGSQEYDDQASGVEWRKAGDHTLSLERAMVQYSFVSS